MFPAQTNATSTALREMVGSSQVQETSSQGGVAFLTFKQSGLFLYGRDQEDVTGAEIAINVASMRHGWTLWVNNSPTSTWAAFNQAIPAPPEPVAGNVATEARSFQAMFLDEADTVLEFSSNSVGGRQAFDNVLNAVKIIAASGSDFMFPIVQLGSDSYNGKHGKVHNPVFTIVNWMDAEGNIEADQAKVEEKPEAEEATPKRKRRTA